jgi:hypothetical protein
MPDMFDHAQEVIEQQLARDLANAGVGSFVLPAGEPGDCDDCGYPSPRLIDGRRAPCRDLPRRVH